jgi:hypothetical protein
MRLVSLLGLVVLSAALGCSKKTAADGATRADAAMSVVTTDDAAVVLELAGGGGGAAAAGADGGATAASADGTTSDGGAGAAASGEATADGGTAPGSSSAEAAHSGGTPADPHPTEGGAPAGTVTFDKIDTGGDLPPDAVQKFLTKNRDGYRSCYGKALGVRHSTAGRLNLKVVVLPTGAVEEAEVIGGTLPPSPLIQCSVAKTKKLRFVPPPSTRVTMKYEVSFSTP